MAHKKWVVRDADREKASAISEKFDIDAFVAFLLVSRGIDTSVAVSDFLSHSFESVPAYKFADLEEASFIIGDAIDNGERICIYGDYDCDGVTSTALLYSFFKREGADVFYYIPDRIDEGYGMNTEAIDKIHAAGAQLIVTVDNGISSIGESEYIYSLGMRLVVTDHHQIGDSLPKAEAVVNPYRPENELDFCDYCGVGIAFKLVQAMYEGDFGDLVEEYIDLVALGTLADVVPLVGENRSFVREGLKKINNNPRPALEAFVSSNGVKEYSAGEIVFQLCPKINAMGRMGDASRAVEFLISEDKKDCEYKYEQLSLENTHRQETERKILEEIENIIKNNPRLTSGRVIVIEGEGWHHGVTGIVASHLAEKYSKPALVISINGDKTARGSARSIEGFNIFEAISECKEDLIRFGGHPQAAGITLYEDKISDFRKHINEYALKNYDMLPPQELNIDLKISPDYLTLELADSLSVLEPYGAANPQAVFGVYKMKLVSVTPLKEGKHIRLELEKRGRIIRAVKFSSPYEEFPYKKGDILNLAVKISKSFYREKYYLSIQTVDIRLAETDDEKYFKEKNDYELYRLMKKAVPSLYPEREVCALIYKYLKLNGGYAYTVDDLYFRLQKHLTYGQLMLALGAFSEAGLIKKDKKISLLPVEGKVRLEDTKVLKSVRERLQLG
ncbi:MAG: single-stranded-DNA-specific exonuclease RecJ [Eubacterium sp.]|nr:single-stranded-DNA-specific exonuclease RecJ [Eubacterium sp.]